MKNVHFKSVLPVLLMIAAITSAFAFQNDGKAATTTSSIGWIDHQTPCSVSFECDNIGDVVCTESYMGNLYEVKAKSNPADLTCPVRLTRSE